MDTKTLLKKPSAFLPLIMSSGALAVVVISISIFGVVWQQDEGAAAHLFQLLIALQVPIALFFAFSWLPTFPKLVLLVVALQVTAAILASAPVLILEM